MSHRKKDCPRRTIEGVHSQRTEVQSQQQSVTVDRPIRSTQSGTSATHGRPRNQEGRTQGRVYHMTHEDVGVVPDVVAGMDWLSKHKAQVDCFTKTVTIQGIGDKRVVFKGERRVIPSCVISVLVARKLLRKGCFAWLAHVRESGKGSIDLASIPIVREFRDVFPEELPGLPPIREIEVSIETIPGVSPIA
nr:uncharacterized protein LOC118046055 [Populus alba]